MARDAKTRRPIPRSTTVHVRVRPEERAEIERRAAESDTTVSTAARTVLLRGLKQPSKPIIEDWPENAGR